jgi:hypothetical protein
METMFTNRISQRLITMMLKVTTKSGPLRKDLTFTTKVNTTQTMTTRGTKEGHPEILYNYTTLGRLDVKVELDLGVGS